MTGKEFKAIRLHNRIKDHQFAKLFNKSKNFVYEMQNMEFVPEVAIYELGKLINRDLQNEDVLKNVLQKIPEKYLNKKKVVRIKIRYF